MDIAHLLYKNNQYPIRISYYAMKMLKSTTNKNVEELGDDMKLYEDLLFYALVSGARYTDTEMELTREDMEDMLDHCFMEFIEAIPQFFAKKEGEQSGAGGPVDYDEIFAMAAAHTGISLSDFNALTPRALAMLMKEYSEKDNRNFRQHAELERILALQTANVIAAGQGGNTIEDPRRFVQFAWEEDPQKEMEADLLDTPWDVINNIYAN